jgi:pimeloyl-ACP methyl ester carboxylesterase
MKHRNRLSALSLSLAALLAALTACSDDDGDTAGDKRACDAEPERLTTADGVEFVRTPDACFDDLPDWSYVPQYIEIDGLRQAYVDEGPADGEVVLLLHGQPTWSYLYRKMIPVLVDAGFRVIAMDHLGMGRSDKPIDISFYSYLGHCDRLERFIEALDLRDINLFAQDWGAIIGLRVAGENLDRFARIAVGDGQLPVVPDGVLVAPPVENPDEVADIPSPYAPIPAQQVSFYDGCQRTDDGGTFTSLEWAVKGESFHPAEVVEALTWFDLPADEEAAYDAPFPSRLYMAGTRIFASLRNELPGVNQEAWDNLTAFERPFLTIWSSNDPKEPGTCQAQQIWVDSVPGATCQPHTRLDEASHFLQDDQGEEIARRLVEFYSDQSSRNGESMREYRYCEILLGYLVGSELRAEVWGTQGLNECSADAWDSLDSSDIMAEFDALFVQMNGPRYGMMDEGDIEPMDAERRVYGDLEMQRLATLVLDPSSASAEPYTEYHVERASAFTFWSGFESYQLVSPEGVVYVMVSMSQIVDPDLTPADLPDLGDRMALPAGWSYQARMGITDLVLVADGEASMLQDELKNSYQRTSITQTSGDSLPVLPDGTGTVCSSDTDCQGLEASHCLLVGGLGFCTVEGCAGGECGAPYLCCHDCNPDVAAMLPFVSSACFTAEQSTQLTTAPVACTCD